MRDDEEIIAAYERELAEGGSLEDVSFEEPAARAPGSGRGFWIVVVTLLTAGVLLVVEIFANRPIADTIGHAEATLRSAQAAAEGIRARTGSFRDADADGIAAQTATITTRDPEQASSGLDDVSVAATSTTWAAAVRARPGACFYLRLEVDQAPRYGVGTVCTGRVALSASDTRW
jgi:hypothetical protein